MMKRCWEDLAQAIILQAVEDYTGRRGGDSGFGLIRKPPWNVYGSVNFFSDPDGLRS